MVTKPTKPTLNPPALRSLGPVVFNQRVEGNITDFPVVVDFASDSNDYLEEKADQALAAYLAGSVNPGDLTGQAGRPVTVNFDEDGVTFGARVAQLNYIVNSDWSINQEVIDLSGGATLAQGDYFRDRWAATSGGADLTFDGTTATLDGAVGTVIEGQSWAGQTVTFSLENPDGAVHVGISAYGSGSGSVSGTITAGSGQRYVTLVVPATATGSLVLELATTGAVDFDVRLKLEVGPIPTAWEPPDESELSRCQTHWCSSFNRGVQPGDKADGNMAHLGYNPAGANYYDVDRIDYPVSPMRTAPTITAYSSFAVVAGSWHRYDSGGTLWAPVSVSPIRITQHTFTMRCTSSIGGVNQSRSFMGHWTADARPVMTGVNSAWVGAL